MEVGIRDNILAQAGYPSAVVGLRDLQISAVEIAIDARGDVRSLRSDRSWNLTRADELAAFRQELAEDGIRVCALLCAQNFNAGELGPQLDWASQAVEAAAALGAPAIRIDSIMSRQTELPLEERVRIYSDAVLELLRRTAGSEVALGIENHGPQGNDPEWMTSVLRRVGSPRLGVTLDVGNWYWYGHPLSRVYEIYAELGPYVRATHVKNIRYPEELRETQRKIGYEYGKYCCPLDEGDLDMSRVVSILGTAGYDGAMTIEDESLGKFPPAERPSVLRRNAEHLRRAIA